MFDTRGGIIEIGAASGHIMGVLDEDSSVQFRMTQSESDPGLQPQQSEPAARDTRHPSEGLGRIQDIRCSNRCFEETTVRPTIFHQAGRGRLDHAFNHCGFPSG